MEKINLNGKWNLTSDYLDQPVIGIVPGSVYADLFRANLIPDPFVGDNEYAVREVMRYDFCYERSFFLPDLGFGHPILVMEGVDTLATIDVNDKELAKTRNMHRTYRFELEGYVHAGENTIRIHLGSPINFVEQEEARHSRKLYQAHDAIRGFIHLRKAASMFGWDWGPQLPDAGIWRDIYIELPSFMSIRNVSVKQFHLASGVTLEIFPEIAVHENREDILVKTTIYDPDDKPIIALISEIPDKRPIACQIDDPLLWYPSGYGNQPLYRLNVELIWQDTIIDTKTLRIGLCEKKVLREKDSHGESFTITYNGIKVFAKGANYIIEDNILSRQTPESTASLLSSAIKANHNTIRVWGGGIYPPDYFFEICDMYGIIVWQDLMFACAVYEVDDDFLDEIKAEILDNVKRIRNHPSLALICGNNEIETAIADWNVPEKEYSRESYTLIFDRLIPKWLKTVADDIFYWGSSPSSGKLFENPNSDDYGDMHYWGVWHNTEPISNYRKHFPRFMSEFGLQSFPALKTIEYFATKEEQNIFSRIMEHHQKNSSANSKILMYIGQMYRYPRDFSALVYVSQLIQAEGVRYGVEHWRRNYGRTMGTIYWQLNDCWPVASWSGIDYFHRWKALHYHSRKFYQPLLLSLAETKNKVEIHITNDSLEPVIGKVIWDLSTFSGKILEHGELEVKIRKQEAMKIADLDIDYSTHELANMFFRSRLMVDNGIVAENQTNFLPDKYLELVKPTIRLSLSRPFDSWQIELVSDTYAKFVEVSVKDQDLVFSDNYFHLYPNEKRTIDISTEIKLNPEDIVIRSLVDSYE